MRRRAATVAVLLLALAGCSAAPAPLNPDIVALVPPQGGGMDALLEGELAIGDECVTVTIPEGTVLPVFPRPLVEWDGASLVVDGEPYEDGDPIALGGGFSPEDSDFSSPPPELHLPPGCPTELVFLVAG